MFTRSSSAEPRLLEPVNANVNAARNTQQRRSDVSEPGAKSVIGNDLKIIGQGLKIISQGTLQVDGQVDGDVAGAEVIIGEQGNVTGTVAAARVIVRAARSPVSFAGLLSPCSRHRTSKATSITCRSPSSRAPSSTADADGLLTRRSSK